MLKTFCAFSIVALILLSTRKRKLPPREIIEGYETIGWVR